MEEATQTSRAALRPWTPAVVKISAGQDCEEVSPLGSVARVCKFQAADHSVNARVVFSRGFGCAAGFCMFQLWVWEGTAASTLPTTHPESVAESFLHIGNVVVRRQDTSRARVQAAEPFLGDLRVAQVFDSCHLAVSFRRLSRVQLERKLRLELRCTESALPGR